MRTTFLVGRMTPKSSEMVVVNQAKPHCPFPGPWQVKAVVRHRFEPASPRQKPTPTVH